MQKSKDRPINTIKANEKNIISDDTIHSNSKHFKTYTENFYSFAHSAMRKVLVLRFIYCLLICDCLHIPQATNIPYQSLPTKHTCQLPFASSLNENSECIPCGTKPLSSGCTLAMTTFINLWIASTLSLNDILFSLGLVGPSVSTLPPSLITERKTNVFLLLQQGAG